MKDEKQNIDSDSKQLESNWKRSWVLYQAWHWLSLCLAVAGFLLTALVCIAELFRLADSSLTTVLPAVILDTVSGLCFFQMRSTRRQVEIIQEEVFQRRRLESACRAAHEIKDAQKRDEVFADIARKMPISGTRSDRQIKWPFKG